MLHVQSLKFYQVRRVLLQPTWNWNGVRAFLFHTDYIEGCNCRMIFYATQGPRALLLNHIVHGVPALHQR